MGEETCRLWLVDRESRDDRLIRLVYATPDGEHSVTRERSIHLLRRRPATAAVDVAVEDLQPVEDDQLRDRYADEATRIADQHDPDDEI